MVSNGFACQECAQNCVLMHRKQKNPSPVVTRFFKIMIGEDYSKVLFLPPSFARKVRSLIGQQTHLEDSTGRQWPVTISNIDGSLAFQKGWHKFSLDHGLEVGQLLVFSYIKNCHFVVQIYGTSASERLNFNHRSGRPKKRSREGKEKVVQGEPIQTVYINSMVKASPSTSVQRGESLPVARIASDSGSDFGSQQFIPTDISMDDPALMLNRNTGCNQGEDRTYLCDLSNFEMGKNESYADKTKKSLGGEIVLYHSQIRKQTESKANDTQIAENQECHINGHFNGLLSPTEPAENTHMIKRSSNYLSNFQNDKKNNAVLDKEVPSIGCSKLAGRECALIPSYRGRTISVKKEQVEMREVAFSLHQTSSGQDPNKAMKFAQTCLRIAEDIGSIVKYEPDVFVPASPFLVEVKCQSYLELPKLLPLIEGKMEGRHSQVVYLRDSASRLWPVLYTATFGVAALFLDGWKQFCEENFVHSGDLCEIKPENSVWHIFRVDVISKSVVQFPNKGSVIQMLK
ncbi:B3 domain-containing protein [Abeliophyllum distichum]|uniref:B3 domain-containing protein n=1 Tax=Abeliophyllum distichum TaxID=126358 RepID=A0ABD1RXZ3_9LAMI